MNEQPTPIRVSVIYALPHEHFWRELELPSGSDARRAIEQSGVLDKYPEIDLETQKIGVFGRIAKLDKALDDGARVEIYRPAAV